MTCENCCTGNGCDCDVGVVEGAADAEQRARFLLSWGGSREDAEALARDVLALVADREALLAERDRLATERVEAERDLWQEREALLERIRALEKVAEAARGVIAKSVDEEGVEWISLLPGGQQALWKALEDGGLCSAESCSGGDS